MERNFKIISITVVLVFIGGLALDAAGWNPVAGAVNGFRYTIAIVGPAGVILVGALVLATILGAEVWSYDGTYGRRRRSWLNDDEAKKARRVQIGAGLAVAVAVLAFAGSIFDGVTRTHRVRHRAINTVLTVEKAQTPAYSARPAFPQSSAMLIRDLGEIPGQRVGEVWRFRVQEGDEQVAKTCALLTYTRQQWRRPAAGVACRTDDGLVERVMFTGRVPVPATSLVTTDRLADRVNGILPFHVVDHADVYAYVARGEAFMVVPTRRIVGQFPYRHGWGGTVVFDGNGGHQVHRTLDGSVPGPAFGISNANEVLRALNNRGGFWAAQQAEFSYDLTENSEVGTGNVSHFLLNRADGTGERLVTMLTPKGDSETPTAILEISLTGIELGQWPQATLYQLPGTTESQRSRASNSEVLAHVRNLYGPALQLADSGNRLMELTPLGGDLVAVTIGTERVALARVTFDQITRRSCVYAMNGTLVRCYDDATTQLSRDGLSELFTDTDIAGNDAANVERGSAAPVRPVVQPGDFAGLSDAELIDQLQAISAELARRQQG
jgi:hypothetical protein